MRLLIKMAFILLLAAPVSADGFGFRTPSGNIYCNGGLDGAHVYCVIVNRQGGSAPQGVACPAGRQLEVGLEERGQATASCGRASGRLSSYLEIAEYGVTGQFGLITCQSESTGFSCRNADGHGFFLSRRAQQIF